MNNESHAVPSGMVVPHAFYKCTAFDLQRRAEVVDSTPELNRQLSRVDHESGAPVPDASFVYTSANLDAWPYVIRLQRLFSDAGREAIESRLLPADRIGFATFGIEMADGRRSHVYLHRPVGTIDVLSPHSQIDPWGVARWWALDLSKLRGHSFFAVPHASSTTAVRGSTVLALFELGATFEAYPLRVMDGKRRVDYAEWAEHPEWTTP